MNNFPPDSNYEYRGAMAEYWDLLRGDTSGWSDRFFYLEVIRREGQPVLDVGCGTGRLLLDYLQHGIDIDGIDNSPEMLALCRRRATSLGLDARVYTASMDRLALPRLYRVILVPSSSFQLVTDLDHAAATLKNLYNLLLPQGVLVMSFYLEEIPPGASGILTRDWEINTEAVRTDGAVVRRWSRSQYDVANRLEHTEDRYEIIKNGQVVESEHFSRSPATRFYTQAESRILYEAAGFTEIILRSGFTDDPAIPEDTLWTVEGRKLSS